MSKETAGRKVVLGRVPPDVKAWLETQAGFHCSSQNAVLVRVLRAAMAQSAAKLAPAGPRDGYRDRRHSVPEGRRALDPAKVKAIAASIKLIGMLAPIRIRRHGDAPVELIWGSHRFTACLSLGMKRLLPQRSTVSIGIKTTEGKLISTTL